MLRRKIWLINFVLIFGIIGMVMQIHALWQTSAADAYARPQGQADGANSNKAGQKDLPFDLENLKARLGPEKEYNAMSEKNLFSANRRGQVLEQAGQQKESEPKEEKKPAGESMPVELYGIIWTKHYQAALLNNPYAENPADPNKWFKPGDSVGGGSKGDEVVVTEIHEDHVVLTVNGKNRELHLYKKNQEVVATVQNGASPDSSAQKGNAGASNPRPSSSQDNMEISEDGKYRILDTPFGKIKRRIN